MQLHSYIEAELTAGTWTDISNDVLADPGPRVSYGIKGTTPLDLMAQPGTFSFALRNDQANSGAKLGYYTPGHANCRAGWDEGVRVRWRLAHGPHYGSDTMHERIMATCPNNLIGYWPMGEASGASSWDHSKEQNNGAYTGVTLGATGIGDGRTSASFDGSTSYNNIYSAGLASDFNGAEGTLLIWAKVANAGVWTDGVGRNAVALKTAAGDSGVVIRKQSSNGQLILWHFGGATAKYVVIASLSTTAWMCLAITWSESADQVKIFYNGAQSGSTQTSIGTWSGTLQATRTGIGADVTTPLNIWSGPLAHCALWTTPLSPAEIAGLSAALPAVDTTTYASGDADGESYIKFIGRVRKIQPTAGQYRDRRVSVEARDWLDVASKVRTQQVPALANMRADEALPYLIDPVVDQPDDRDFDRGVYIFPQVLDVGKDEATTILAQLAKFSQSEQGFIFTRGSRESEGGGILTFGNRHSRVPQLNILSGSSTGCSLSTNASQIFSKWTLAETPLSVSALMTRATATCVGYFFAMDNPFAPLNYITAYETAGSVFIGKVLSGSHSTVMGPCAIGYVAASPFAATLSKTAGSLFLAVKYGGSLVGGAQVIGDAAIVSNPVHGIMSTCADSSMVGFSLDQVDHFSASLNETMTEMGVDYSSDPVVNRYKIQVYPRRIDTAACTVITALEKPIMLMPGETKVVTLNYRDPASQATRIAAMDFDDLMVDRDYQFGSGDGPGANDMNALLTITSKNGANSAEFTLTNTAALRQGYVTRIGLRARGIYLYDPVVATVEDGTSIAARGEIERTVDIPYQTSQTWGKALADFLISRSKNPQKVVTGLRFCANQNAALLQAALACEPSSRVTVTESMTAIANDFNVNSVDLEIMPSNKLWCSWGLVLSETDNYFRPGLPGSCEVGVSACVFGI